MTRSVSLILLALTALFLVSLFWVDGGNLDSALLSPSAMHWLGTDSLGRDYLLRVFQGGAVSLLVATGAAVISFSLGCMVGMAAGLVGGIGDTIVMRFVDAMDALPDILLGSVMVIAFSQLIEVQSLMARISLLIVAMGASGWMSICRQARALTLREGKKYYVDAARTLGATPTRIVIRHIFPNIFNFLKTVAFFQIPAFMLFEASLSFFGVGIQPPHASWGWLLNEGWRFLEIAPWLASGPAAFLTIMLILLQVGSNRKRSQYS